MSVFFSLEFWIAILALSVMVMSISLYVQGKQIDDSMQHLWERLRQLRLLAPVGNLFSLLFGETVGERLKQRQKEDCILTSESLQLISDGVCVCLSQDGIDVLRADIEPLIDAPLNCVCDIFRIEEIGEGHAYYLVFNKGNDELYRFLASKGTSFEIRKVLI